jgi:hypothetical protein
VAGHLKVCEVRQQRVVDTSQHLSATWSAISKTCSVMCSVTRV